ncbi:MAG TPA: GNAT family N-acetyltransferase [Candidatus Lokiarchaeia archaeon]|nr:GNAT family N-acetyltransferase [Candidatus Lokiarchaeia archaeon]
MSFNIREAKQEDSHQIIPLAIELYSIDAYTAKDLVENYPEVFKAEWTKLNFSAWLIFVAEVEGSIVGYIKGRIIPWSSPVLILKNAAVVEEFVVDSSWRGQGIGRALMETFEETVHDDVDRIVLNAGATNPAIAFYEKAGFRILSHRMEKRY